MPSNAARNTLARHWELLRRLPSRGTGKTAKQLVAELADAGFCVSKRQVERDLLELQAVFALDCNDAGVPYGWRWPPNGSADLPALTLAEALSVKIVEETLRPLLPNSVLRILQPRFEQASAKLQTLKSQNRTAQWAEKVRTVAPAMPLCPPEIDSDVLEAVQAALLSDHQLDARYQNSDEHDVALRLHPLALVNRGQVTYLVATAFDYADVRLYALHRFRGAQPLFEPSRRPQNFDIDRYLESGGLHFGARSPIKLELKVSLSLAHVLRETPLAVTQTLQVSDDHALLAADVVDTWQLRWWILSQGDEVEVLKPLALRTEIYSTLEQALKNYSG